MIWDMLPFIIIIQEEARTEPKNPIRVKKYGPICFTLQMESGMGLPEGVIKNTAIPVEAQNITTMWDMNGIWIRLKEIGVLPVRL